MCQLLLPAASESYQLNRDRNLLGWPCPPVRQPPRGRAPGGGPPAAVGPRTLRRSGAGGARVGLALARWVLGVGAAVALAGVGVCVAATLLHPEAMEP